MSFLNIASKGLVTRAILTPNIKIKRYYRFPSLFAVETFRHFGSRILNFADKNSIFDWKIVILDQFFQCEQANLQIKRPRITRAACTIIWKKHTLHLDSFQEFTFANRNPWLKIIKLSWCIFKVILSVKIACLKVSKHFQLQTV